MALQNKTILIVDDSPMILRRLVAMMQRMESGFSVVSAENFDDAVDLLSKNNVDIALFDIHLHDKSGIDLLRIAKDQYPELIVIMITNQSNEEFETLCKKLGAEYFLDKSKDFARIPGIIAAV